MGDIMENRIRQLRQERQMTQVRLSIELEVSQETVSSYESGKHYPSYQILVQLSQILNTSIDYMMGLSDVRHPELYPLSKETTQALAVYSALPQHQKEKALAYMQGLLDQ